MAYNAACPFYVKGEPDREKARQMYKTMVKIALPSAVEGALISVISAVDTMMVGSLGPAAIAAVGLTAQPRLILLVFAQALCIGTTAVIGRRKGAEDHAGARSCLYQSMAIITMIGLLMGLFAFFFAESVMRFAGANAETLPLATKYFKILALGFVPSCWQLCICAAFRATGKTAITMTTNGIANIVNVTLNYLLIAGRHGFPRLEVEGAAIATLIGNCTASLIALRFAGKRDGYFAYHFFKRFRFDRETLHHLFTLGGASAMEALFLRSGFLILQKIVAGIGTVAFASYQIVSQITGLSFTVGDGLATAGVAMVAQSLGAKKKEKAMQYVYIARRLGLFVSLCLMAFILIFRNVFPTWFTDDAAVIASASLSFLIVAFGVASQNGRVIYAGCLRGAGDVKYVAVCSLTSVTLLRPFITYACCVWLHDLLPHYRLDETGPWISYVLDAGLRHFFLARRIKQGKWTHIEIA